MKGNRIKKAKPGDVVLLQKIEGGHYFSFDDHSSSKPGDVHCAIKGRYASGNGFYYVSSDEIEQIDPNCVRVSEICILSTAEEMINEV